jgi:hypothetical protein
MAYWLLPMTRVMKEAQARQHMLTRAAHQQYLCVCAFPYDCSV